MSNSFTVRLAGVSIQINPLFDYIKEYCRDYLSDGVAEFSITTTQQDIASERERSAAEDRLEGIPVREFSDAYLETLAVYRKIAAELLNKNILLYHGSCVAVDGTAYLFTAKSGTGKSTHVRLWQQMLGDRATVINDDKPLLAVTENGVIAYGTPWDGKHRKSKNMSCPLKAICVLTRGDTNKIEKITAKDEFGVLLQQVYRPKEPAELLKTLGILDRLLSQTELYRLSCNMNPEAAVVSFRGMNGGSL